MKLLQFFQYAYLIIALLFIYEAITLWNENRSKAYMVLLFAALAIFMFFFRKRFRKKIEDRNKS